MRVLAVEDDPIALDLLEYALVQFGYEVTRANNGQEALAHIRRTQFSIIISDWEMPAISGVELCRLVRQRVASNYTYIILLTSRSETRDVVAGLNAGADEFLIKPFNPHELYVRLRVAERILSLESRDVLIFSMAKLTEARDPETGAHLERIRAYCYLLANKLSQWGKFQGELDSDFIQLLHMTSPLHDIGKVGIPDAILLKPGRLTPDEFAIMKQHTLIGGQTLDAAAKAFPQAKYLQVARDIALSHHEKFDGSGYPHGLAGDEIPLCGRIVAVSDVYDALTTARVYKPAYSHEVAKSIIEQGRGTHFDPAIVDSFLASEPEIVHVREQLGGEADSSDAWMETTFPAVPSC